ncbi:MAG: hypothetical protein RIT45_1307 [Pseudomonadota bacterium]
MLLVAPDGARAACRSARPDASVLAVPDAWQRAVEALIASTGEPSHPWSCRGGVVGTRMTETGARLRVQAADDAAVERSVAVP